MKVFAVDGTLNISHLTVALVADDIRSRATEGDIAFLFDTQTYGEAPALQAEKIFIGSGGGSWVQCALDRAAELGATDIMLYGDGFWLGKDADQRGLNVEQVLVGHGPYANSDWPCVALIV